MSELNVQGYKNRWNVKAKTQATRELQKDEHPNSDYELPKSLADSLIMHHECLKWPRGEGEPLKLNRSKKNWLFQNRLIEDFTCESDIFFFYNNWTEL